MLIKKIDLSHLNLYVNVTTSRQNSIDEQVFFFNFFITFFYPFFKGTSTRIERGKKEEEKFDQICFIVTLICQLCST